MKIRMHIVEESRAEFNELPQDWIKCKCSEISKSGACLKCGTLEGAIKEPRFMKNTNHLDPVELYRQMREDHKFSVATKLADMKMSTEGSDTASNCDENFAVILTPQDQAFI